MAQEAETAKRQPQAKELLGPCKWEEAGRSVPYGSGSTEMPDSLVLAS